MVPPPGNGSGDGKDPLPTTSPTGAWDVFITEDGTPSLRHTGLDEACHARQGAKREAALKFTAPALKHVTPRPPPETLRVLDACFGLGYNSFEFLAHPDLEGRAVSVLAVEWDPVVWSKVPLLGRFYPGWRGAMGDLASLGEGHVGEKSIHPACFDLTDLLVPGSRLTRRAEQQGPFDLIFHDAFSTAKVPELWTVEMAMAYLRILRPGGALFTYSSAHPVCAAFIEAGFSVSYTAAVDRKKGGLQAVKPPVGEPPVIAGDLLELHECTTARAPYRHVPSGPGRREKILAAWEAEKKGIAVRGGLTIKQWLRKKGSPPRQGEIP